MADGSAASTHLVSAFDEAVGRILKAATGGAAGDDEAMLWAEFEVRGRIEELLRRYESETRAKHHKALASVRQKHQDKLTRQRTALQAIGKENVLPAQGGGTAGPSHMADVKLLAEREKTVTERERSLVFLERKLAKLSQNNVEREQDLEVLEMRIKDQSSMKEQELRDFKRRCATDQDQALASCKQDIAGRKDKLLQLEARIGERERAVSSAEADIGRRAKNVAVAESAMRSRERASREQLLALRQQLLASEATVSERQERFDQADRQLYAHSRALEEKLHADRESLTRREGVVAKRQRELDSLEHFLLGRECSVKEAEHAFSSRERQLEDRERRVTEQEKQLHDSLQRMKCRLADQENETARTKREVDALQEDLASQEQDFSRKRQHLDELEQIVAQERSKLSIDEQRCDSSTEADLWRRREAEERSRLCFEAAELAARAEALERKEAEYLQGRADLAVLQTKLDSNQQSLTDRSARQRESEQNATALHSGLVNWERELQHRERAASESRAELTRARAQEAELTNLERTVVAREEASAQREQQLAEREQRLMASEQQFTSHDRAQRAERECTVGVQEQASSCDGDPHFLYGSRPRKTARKQVAQAAVAH